ncbi:MAG: amino acid ABC transporter substrate-binding protein [Nitrospinota bacterium]
MAQTLRVGASLSLTGPFSPMGRQARAAVELWAEEVTRAGGIDFRPGEKRAVPRLVLLDDGSRRKEAARLTHRLIRDEGVEILLGPYSSALTLAAAPVAEDFEIPLWNHGGSADALYERGFRFLVGVVPPASTYFRGAFEWAREAGFAGGRVALLHGARGGFPAAVAGGALRWAGEGGFEVVLRRTYPSSAAGLARLTGELRAIRPDLILGAGRFEEDLAFARALREATVAAKAAVLVAAGVSAFGDALGGDADGFLGPSQWEAEGGGGSPPEIGPTGKDFAKRLTARLGAPADYPAAQAYAACLIAERCLRSAGMGNPARLRDAASSLRLTTFFGPFEIDPGSGRPLGVRAPLLVQWRGGRRVIVWSPSRGLVTPTVSFR